MSSLKTLAVGSGKGGVGKTLTSVNLGISAVRSGLKVLLVDADPLSNIMAMLDQPVPDKSGGELKPHVCRTVPGFDVLSPSTEMIKAMFSTHYEWMAARYNLAIVDMPAGTGNEDSFSYLEYMNALVLVTNPEPTAHVSAGAFLRSVMRYWKKRPVYLWHNKYNPHPEENFNPEDVVGNYNKNVPEEHQIDRVELVPIAYVPPDSALDLTRADPPVLLDLHKTLAGVLSGLLDAAVPPLPHLEEDYGSRTAALLNYFLRHSLSDSSDASALDKLESFFFNGDGKNAGGKKLPVKAKRVLQDWFKSADSDPLRKQIEKASYQMELRIRELENADNQFAGGLSGAGSQKNMDREIMNLLNVLEQLPAGSPAKSLACLFFFRYALYKLFSMDTSINLIDAAIPRRKELGGTVRDRRKQIAGLLGQDPDWKKFFVAVVRKLHPVMMRQIVNFVETAGLQSLLFRDGRGQIDKKVYLKLFSESMYEIINGGLGIVSGFRFRPSSRAFQEGYNALMEKLNKKETLYGNASSAS